MAFFIDKIICIYFEKTRKFIELVDGKPVVKKKSVFKDILKERGYGKKQESEKSYAEVQIDNINYFVMYSVKHLNNSYAEAIDCDYIDMLDTIIFDIENRLKTVGGA